MPGLDSIKKRERFDLDIVVDQGIFSVTEKYTDKSKEKQSKTDKEVKFAQKDRKKEKTLKNNLLLIFWLILLGSLAVSLSFLINYKIQSTKSELKEKKETIFKSIQSMLLYLTV